MRGYNVFLGEEAAQSKKFTTNIGMSMRWVWVTDTNGTVLVASAGEVMSVTNAHWNIQIQNLRFRAATPADHLAPVTFSLGLVDVRVERFRYWILGTADLPDWAAPS